MRKKRVMIIGPSGCGKTALANALNGCDKPLRKTQNITYGDLTIDVPGSYIENTDMYKHLIATAQHASHILILVDQSRCTEVYSPGFTKAFRKPVVGVVSKCDLNEENHENCIRQLKRAGAEEPYFFISNHDGTGIEELKHYLLENSEAKGGVK